MVLPIVNKGSHLFKWPYYFNKSFVFEYREGDRYNLLANHARFQKQNMSAMMTRPNMTKFITVLREPVFQLESLYSYFKFHKPLKTSEDNGIWEFFKTVETDRTELVKKLKSMRAGVVKRLMKNPNAFDLGFDQWNEYPSEIKKIVTTVQNDFNLVMISEYMMESLLLLKDELCWDLSDIVFFTMNKRPNKFRKNVSPNRDTIRKWSRIDYALYDHFNKTLWKKIAKKGETFQQELKALKQMKKDLETLCLAKGEFYDKTQSWFQIEGYQIKKEARDKPYFQLCKQLTRSEIDYTMVLAEKQTRHGYKMPKKTKARLTE